VVTQRTDDGGGSGGISLAAAEPARATVVIVGGHEGGGAVVLEPLAEHGAVLRSSSAGEGLERTVNQALDCDDLPVCVVPMTLGRDPKLVADTARTLIGLTGAAAGGAAAGRIMLAEPFGNATLLTGWLRVAVARAAAAADAPDVAVLLTADTADPFDDAELFRIAHLVRVQGTVPWVEVAFRDGDPSVAEGVDRCRRLGAHQVALVSADFRSNTFLPGVIDGGPLLSPATISGMLATRITSALFRLNRGDDGIATGLDADHEKHGHVAAPWQE
jgi:hypothetical protein